MNKNNLELMSPFKRMIRILFVEDNRADFELCVRLLKNAGLNFHADVVETMDEFDERSRTDTYDIVVCDFQLAGWTAINALRVLRDRKQDTPFIVVTGVLGDESAVDCIKQGASDYVLKDRLSRLPIAITRALHEHSLIRAKEQALNQLRDSEEKFRTLAETTASATFIYRGTQCEYANRAAEAITGYSREELLALDSWDLVHPDSREVVIQMGLSRAPGDISSQRYEARIITKTGEARWLDCTSGIVEIEGEPRGLLTAFDVTQRKIAEEEVRQLAASDPLTGLANYRRLLEVFETEMERSRRTGRSFSLILLDLDGLKRINDTHGHLVGSRALCRVSSVLRSQCRSLDTAARYGGDEFAIVLPETGADNAKHLAQRIAACLAEDGETPSVSVSYGVAVYPNDGTTSRDVIRIADRDLYQMKGQVQARLADSA